MAQCACDYRYSAKAWRRGDEYVAMPMNHLNDAERRGAPATGRRAEILVY